MKTRRLIAVVLTAFLVMGAEGGCEEEQRNRRTPTPTQLPSREWSNTVEHGAYCDGKKGQTATTHTGIPVECKTNPGERRPRWRNA